MCVIQLIINSHETNMYGSVSKHFDGADHVSDLRDNFPSDQCDNFPSDQRDNFPLISKKGEDGDCDGDCNGADHVANFPPDERESFPLFRRKGEDGDCDGDGIAADHVFDLRDNFPLFSADLRSKREKALEKLAEYQRRNESWLEKTRK